MRPKFALVAAALCLLFSAGSAPAATELPKLLQRGKALRDLSGAAGSEVVYRVDVPEGAFNLVFATKGGRGNCDLYVNRSAHPTIGVNQGASVSRNTRESLAIGGPQSGAWYAMVHGADGFSGVRLVASYELSPGAAAVPSFEPAPGTFAGAVHVTLRVPKGPGLRGAVVRYTTDGSVPTETSARADAPLSIGATTTVTARTFLANGTQSLPVPGVYTLDAPSGPVELSPGTPLGLRIGDRGSFTVCRVVVPPGDHTLRVSSAGGTGNSALYLRRGVPPTATEFDKRSNRARNMGLVIVEHADPGDWYVGLRGVTAYSGVQLLANLPIAVPDLVPVIDGAPYESIENFGPNSCEVVEGLIVKGTRRLVRFTTESRNIGGVDLRMGKPNGNPLFVYHGCHGHYHFNGFASYRLLDQLNQVAATGIKVSFCLEDVRAFAPDAAPRKRFDCDNQGIQPGWGDVYDSGLPGQWVDVTGVPPGDYQVEITLNPDRILVESDYTNNTVRVPFTIRAP